MTGLPPCKARATVHGNAIIVEDVEESRCLYAHGFYGHPLGEEKPKTIDVESPVRLSPLEALYLYEKGVLEVVDPRGARLGKDDLSRLLEEYYPGQAALLYSIYRSLREAGLVVRTGLRYGSDFTVYRYGPGIDHAPFIVHAYSLDHALEPTDLVRAGRLSHSVRKTFILASIDRRGDPVYLMLKWHKP